MSPDSSFTFLVATKESGDTKHQGFSQTINAHVATYGHNVHKRNELALRMKGSDGVKNEEKTLVRLERRTDLFQELTMATAKRRKPPMQGRRARSFPFLTEMFSRSSILRRRDPLWQTCLQRPLSLLEPILKEDSSRTDHILEAPHSSGLEPASRFPSQGKHNILH